MESTPLNSSIKNRVLISLGLMASFYICSIGLAILIMMIPVSIFLYAGEVDIRIAVIGIGAGIAILVKIFPRKDKFEIPGVQIKPNHHPQFFAQLREVARMTGEEMPTEVYLIPDVNAWVAERGGWMGYGSRRIMGIGLPLLQITTISELRAVLGHEFGHYKGGDTKWSSRLYQIRGAIARLVQGTNSDGGVFSWYWKIFLKLTQSISREQELLADQIAARYFGGNHFINALSAIHGADTAYRDYWRSELMPAIKAGFRPPVAEGFGRFLQAAKVSDAISSYIDEEMKESQADPFDSHPPFRERVVGLQNLPAKNDPFSGAPAISLLTGLPAMERMLLEFCFSENDVRPLKQVKWEEIGAQFYLPLWQSLVNDHRHLLSDITPRHFEYIADDMEKVGRKFGHVKNLSLSVSGAIDLAAAVIGSALALHLLNQGWKLQTSLGDEIIIENGVNKIMPFEILYRFSSGKLTNESWERQCAEINISDLDLGKI